MPFPLAHPAAILPLRRLCPRRFNFPALVIGSICPDVGYCFGQRHIAKISHSLLAGSFEFGLPVGLLLLWLFYQLRRPVVQLLPALHRRVFEPLCLRPAGSRLVIIISLLTGVWTHILLDSLTHRNGWLVAHQPILRTSLGAGSWSIQIFDLLYACCTFTGVAWLALVYLHWLEQAAGAQARIWPGFKWATALLLAAFTLLLSFANHACSSAFGLITIAVLTVVLALGFFHWVTCWTLRDHPSHQLAKPDHPAAGATRVQLAKTNEIRNQPRVV